MHTATAQRLLFSYPTSTATSAGRDPVSGPCRAIVPNHRKYLMMLIRQNTTFRLERALPTSCHGMIPCVLSAGRWRRTLTIDAHPRNAMHLRQHQSGTTAMHTSPHRGLSCDNATSTPTPPKPAMQITQVSQDSPLVRPSRASPTDQIIASCENAS